MTDAEQDILIRWKKRSDTLQAGADESGDDSTRFSRRRAGYYRGGGRAGRGTVRRRLSRWRGYRLVSVVTGHVGNGNAVGPGRA